MNKATLLLLPGLDGTGIMFKPLLAVMSSEWDIKVQSYPQDPGLKYPDLVELVREARPENDYFILGESFSGPIALKFASEKPKGLRGVILCATFVRNPSFFPAYLRWMVTAPLFFVWPVSLKLNFLTTFRNTEELLSLMHEVRQVTNNRVLASRTREALGVNVEKEFIACPYPMLFLCGARDIVVPGHNLQLMRKLRPDMPYRCLNTSHLVLQEAPREAAMHIDAFMSGKMIEDIVKGEA